MPGIVQQIKYTVWGALNREFLKPTAAVDTFADLVIPKDTKLVILDKDNCFAKPHTLQVWPPFVPKWQALAKEYDMVVLSNTAGDAEADPSGQLAEELEREIKIPVLRHQQKKPMCWKDIKEEYAQKGIPAEQICVVGDRLVTDVLMANLMGAKSVWIRPGVHPSWLNKMEMLGSK